eukprot:tig00022099_g23808.t1
MMRTERSFSARKPRPFVAVSASAPSVQDVEQPGGETSVFEPDEVIDAPAEAGDWLESILGDHPSKVDHPTFQAWRDEARAAFARKEFVLPTRRTEGWRLSDLSGLVKTQFGAPVAAKLTSDDVAALTQLPEGDKTRAVFVDGVFRPDLSNLTGLPAGVLVGGAEALKGKAAELPLLANGPHWRDPRAAEIRTLSYSKENRLPMDRGLSTFAALNQACFRDVACVFVPRGVTVEAPIHVVFVSDSTGPNTARHPRCVAVFEEDSSATLVEEYVSKSSPEASGSCFTNSVTDVHVGDRAALKHVFVQDVPSSEYSIAMTAVRQGQESRYTAVAAAVGGKVSRHDLDVELTAEGSETKIRGLTVVSDKTVAETQSRLQHRRPHAASDHVHTCIAAGQARAVFSGKIQVAKEAQQTNAGQLSRSLLLNNRARVELMPVLEIRADDVKCTHGATCSDLDQDELFYFESRGIDKTTARELMVLSFASGALSEVPYPALVSRVQARARAVLPGISDPAGLYRKSGQLA